MSYFHNLLYIFSFVEYTAFLCIHIYMYFFFLSPIIQFVYKCKLIGMSREWEGYGITSEGVQTWMAFGKARGFLRLPTALCFILHYCNLISQGSLLQRTNSVSATGGPLLPWTACLTNWEFKGRRRSGIRSRKTVTFFKLWWMKHLAIIQTCPQIGNVFR